MDQELVRLLEKISEQTGKSVEKLIELAVSEFVHSFDVDFAGANRVLRDQPDEDDNA